MRKLFLTFVMALLCNVVSFAQSDIIQISSAEDFLKIGTNSSYPANGSYQQTADIDLGTFTQNDAIIPTFSGTYDGNGYSITYQANFTATNSDVKLGLFGTVTGTIKNLKLANCSMTCSMTAEGANNTFVGIGLLCGYLDGSSNAVSITDCNVINGTINSTISTANWYARVTTGLIAGKVKNGIIKYSSATGSVTGCGYVGGLIGQTENGDVVGSSFVGSASATFDSGNWWADLGSNAAGTGRGPYVGGIIGFADNYSSINLCYVKADIEVEETILDLWWFGEWDMYAGSGLGSTTNDGIDRGDQTGTPLVTNSYAEGTINGEPIENKGDLTNSANTNNGNNYYEGATVDDCDKTNAECIAEKLNTAVTNSDAVPNEEKNKIQFSVSDDDNVIFGVVIGENENRICGVPTNLVVSNNAGTCIATWESAPEGDNIIDANTWKYMLSGGDLSQVYHGTTTNTTLSSPLPASQNPYTFTVYTDCSATVNGLTSEAVSQTFTVPCPIPTGLTASEITDNGFKISWTANVDCQLTVNEIDYEISAGNLMEKTITGLEPETQYTAIVKAKCGNEYVEQASINVTTARLAAPTGLTVTPTWQSTSGKIVVTWDMIDDLTYEIYGESGDKVSEFEKTGLSVGAYTLKLRAKKGEKTSEWVSMPYTISNPEAPKNPIVTYTQTESTFRVSIDWTKGVGTATGWKVGENNISKPYVLESQTPGESFDIEINEISSAGTSAALVVPIQVPCLPASEPTGIVPALNSVRFNFADEKTRKIVIGSTEYNANATSVTINELTEGTSYAYEIREYCNTTTNTYSSINGTFSTLACYAVAGLSVSNVELTTATVSWTSQSSIDGLNYKIVVNGGEPTIQTAKTKNLEGLTQSTEYTVEVYEQCGAEENWGVVSSITFTTKGTKNYISATSGDFTTGSTWIGGKAPNRADVDGTTITISQGHTLTLSSTFIITDNYTISNKGVLVIQQGGELINETDNNVGGIIEVVTPVKQNGSWTFIGAPFRSGYKLGSIKPVSGSDVAMVEYDYNTAEWSDYFVNYETTMSAAEGAFAWMFYDGVVTFSTYDLGQNGTSYPANADADYALNNEVVTVTETLKNSATSQGYWMALSNPYPAKLSVKKFVDENDPVGAPEIIQGRCVYVFRNGTFDMNAGQSGNQGLSSGDIGMTEGFFVNFKNAGENSVTFTKEQLTNYPSSSSKSTNASYEFIELTLQNGKDKVRVYFAQNEDAEQGYDILDANKMFATTGVAEPYFVTDGIALIKEEVRDLPYYATMNVRSQQDTVMNFVLTNLPEGYAVSIIDGEEVIDLVEGGVYSTEIASGENADRFKVLVKKNVGLADVEELDVRIINSNRHITITAQENVKVSVYNTLGQKVFETEETNFVLSGVASGAYVVKVQGAKASKSQKIVVE